MADLTVLKAKVDAVAAVVPTIAEDYATLKALIEEWKKKVEDPTLQAQIDALVAKLDASVIALKAVDDTVPNPVPEIDPQRRVHQPSCCAWSMASSAFSPWVSSRRVKASRLDLAISALTWLR